MTAADVSMTPLELWGWWILGLTAIALILSGAWRSTRAGGETADERRRRERNEAARRAASARAAARHAELERAAQRGRLAGVTAARSTIPHRRWRDDIKGADR